LEKRAARIVPTFDNAHQLVFRAAQSTIDALGDFTTHPHAGRIILDHPQPARFAGQFKGDGYAEGQELTHAGPYVCRKSVFEKLLRAGHDSFALRGCNGGVTTGYLSIR